MKKIVLLLAAVFSANLQAGTFECYAKINHVLVYGNGTVNIHHTGRGDFTVICNLKETYGGVDATTCAMWTAMLQHIKKNNGTAHFYYLGTGTCASLGTYGNAVVPVYVGNMAN